MTVTIRELAERHWNGEADLVHEHHPVRPVLGRAAEEIAPGILTLISVASVNAVDTGDGLVMLDTGGTYDSDHVYDSVRAWRPDAPLRAAVYSHHHVDHVFGTRR
ncbi:MAG: MBL fold metallo-hydrolase, partial [Actinomycetota bacterium]|nr:MBL fold metallo-hydrolase [Actinomycetota bacterium]